MIFSEDFNKISQKWREWCNKSEEEQLKIAEENIWTWYTDWYDSGDALFFDYCQADTDEHPTKKMNAYDGWEKERIIHTSNVFLGMDGSFHQFDKPVRQWEEFQPCENTDCKYHEENNHCGFFGDNERMYDCFAQMFASLQALIDVDGYDALDRAKEKFNIHEDIIGWFKDGGKYFENKQQGDDRMYFLERLGRLKYADDISVFWTENTMYVNDESDGQATENCTLFDAYRFAMLIGTPHFDYSASDEEVKHFQKKLIEYHKDIDSLEDEYYIDVWDYLDDIADDFKALTGRTINDIDFKRQIASSMSDTGEEDCGMGFGSATYIARLLSEHILGKEFNSHSIYCDKPCNNPQVKELAYKHLQTDTYNLLNFQKELHQLAQKIYVAIDGYVWINNCKYENVVHLDITSEEVDIYQENACVGSILRENIDTFLVGDYNNYGNDVDISKYIDFDIKKVGDF